MRKWLISLAVIAQMSVLGFMVYGKESLIHQGTRIYLQTAPIDPRDPFRGDYVRLHYPINDFTGVDVKLNTDQDLSEAFDRGDRVYAALKPFDVSSATDETALYVADYVSDRKPESGVFLRGRYHGRRGNFGISSRSTARYGIEQLFVEQGRGIAIEEQLGVRGGLQIPLEVELAVGNNGDSTIVGYRFAKLGMQIEIINETPDGNANVSETNQESSNATERPSPVGVRVIIANASDRELTIPNPSYRCAWRLRTARSDPVDNTYQPVVDCKDTMIAGIPALTLQAGEQTITDILFADSNWFVQQPLPENQPGDAGSQANTPVGLSIMDLSNNLSWRLIFESPTANMGDADTTRWSGVLASQAFNARAILD